MNRKQGHEGEGLAGKNKDGNSNLPLTEDRTAFTPNSPLGLNSLSWAEANWAFRISA